MEAHACSLPPIASREALGKYQKPMIGACKPIPPKRDLPLPGGGGRQIGIVVAAGS